MLKMQVIGNLGADAQVKYAKDGVDPYLSFSVAHNRPNGYSTVWVNIFWFEGVHHSVEPHLKKGAKVLVSGDCSVEAYIDTKGKPVQRITIFPDTVEVINYAKNDIASRVAPGENS